MEVRSEDRANDAQPFARIVAGSLAGKQEHIALTCPSRRATSGHADATAPRCFVSPECEKMGGFMMTTDDADLQKLF